MSRRRTGLPRHQPELCIACRPGREARAELAELSIPQSGGSAENGVKDVGNKWPTDEADFKSVNRDQGEIRSR